MACLSMLNEESGSGSFVVCANPIFVLAEPQWQEGAELTFEVLESDVGSLLSQTGTLKEYALDGQPFWGKLTTLERCVSTHQGLALLRDKPALRGALTIINRV